MQLDRDDPTGLKLTQFHLFTPFFDRKKQLCNGKTYKKYEKRAFRL